MPERFANLARDMQLSPPESAVLHDAVTLAAAMARVPLEDYLRHLESNGPLRSYIHKLCRKAAS